MGHSDDLGKDGQLLAGLQQHQLLSLSLWLLTLADVLRGLEQGNGEEALRLIMRSWDLGSRQSWRSALGVWYPAQIPFRNEVFIMLEVSS